MAKKCIVSMAALVAITLITGCPKSGAPSSSTSAMLKQGVDLAGSLGKQFGLTSDQVSGALGSILSLGQEKLSSADFSKLSSAVPNTDKYMKQAKDSGAVSGPVGGMNGLSAAFSKLGIPKQTADQLVPTVKQMIGQMGGPEVKQLVDSFL